MLNVTDANEEPGCLAVVSLISSFVAGKCRGEGHANVGEQPAAFLCFCLLRCSPPHTHMRTLAVTQHASLLIGFCHIAILAVPVPHASQQFPIGRFNHVYWRINLYFPFRLQALHRLQELLLEGEVDAGKNLRLNGLVGNPTSLRLDESLDICM